MRQRAAAAATPPRSGDSDQGQWVNQARHRGSYHAVREEPAQDQRSLRDAYAASSQGGVDGPPPIESHARRRRAPGHPSTNMQNEEYQQLQHSPQHYMAEYNKNYGAIDGNANEGSAPHSTGGLPYPHQSQSQRNIGYSASASDVYYAQYTNHYTPQSNAQMSYADPSRPTNNFA